MKRILSLFIAVCVVLSVSSSVYANAEEDVFTIKLREWFPGIDTGEIVVGALA